MNLAKPTVFNVLDHGLIADGKTDNTTAFNALLSLVTANHGGNICFPVQAKPFLFLGPIQPPFTGPSSGPTQVPIRIFGESPPNWNGYWSGDPITGGTILDLRYSGDGSAVAKIDTRGAGTLEIDHLTLVSGGHDSYLFMQTTNTTVFIHDCAIIGNAANSGVGCEQDFIRFGGTAGKNSDGSDAPFQGYGSKLANNFYSKIQRGSIFGNCCNSIEVENETFSMTCGSSMRYGAPYYFDPGLGAENQTNGVRIRGGTIEISHYPYGVSQIQLSSYHTFDSIGLYDSTAKTRAGYYFGAGCADNLLIVGVSDTGTKLMEGSARDRQIVIDRRTDQPTHLQGPLYLSPAQTSNASCGVGTLSNGVATIDTTAVSANSLIFLTDTASEMENVGHLAVTSKTAGKGFTITSSNALDSSTFNWFMIN